MRKILLVLAVILSLGNAFAWEDGDENTPLYQAIKAGYEGTPATEQELHDIFDHYVNDYGYDKNKGSENWWHKVDASSSYVLTNLMHFKK